jgi:hypothetical protein
MTRISDVHRSFRSLREVVLVAYQSTSPVFDCGLPVTPMMEHSNDGALQPTHVLPSHILVTSVRWSRASDHIKDMPLDATVATS